LKDRDTSRNRFEIETNRAFSQQGETMIRHLKTSLGTVSLILALCCAAWAQREVRPNPEDAGLSAHRLERLSEAMRTYVEQGRLPGAVVMVIRRGELGYLEAFGWRDMESRSPMDEDSLFRIFSMTKPITTVAALILFEENKFLMTDPVSKYLPEFADVQVFVEERDGELILEPPKSPITVQQLFLHTSGYPYMVAENVSPKLAGMYRDAQVLDHHKPLAEAIGTLSRLPLLHHPGSAWEYGMSTDILGRLVEVLSGRSLGDFLRERIFEPLGMNETSYIVPEEKSPRVARVYTTNDAGELEPAPEDDWIFLHDAHKRAALQPGGHGLVSTAHDYGRFCRMLLNKGRLDGVRILSRKTVELMTGNHLRDERIATGWFDGRRYGFGLGVRTVLDQVPGGSPASLGAYAWDGYANTTFLIDPDEEMIGVFLSQHIPPNQPDQIWERFTNLLYQAIAD
jgi:CubicO group peptidase (beta-lactamase class C family)